VLSKMNKEDNIKETKAKGKAQAKKSNTLTLSVVDKPMKQEYSTLTTIVELF